MSDVNYDGRLLEHHPADSLHRVRMLLALYLSVEWNGHYTGARAGEIVLMDEVMAALEVIEKQVSELQGKV